MSRNNVTEIIIGVLAIISIVLVAIESLVSMSWNALMFIYVADLLICLVFAWDFLQRLLASGNRSQFMKKHGYEIIAMIPAVSLYALGTIPEIAAALRSLRLLRVMRIILLLARMERMLYIIGGFIKRSHLLTLLGVTISIIFIGAYTVLLLDSGTENAKITNFLDAIWWSISTVTTVGYGDIVPSSIEGRVMGMVLMIIGIGIMAAFISQVSATLVESRLKHVPEKDLKSGIIDELKNRLDNIDKLSEDEVSLMIQTIKALRSDNNGRDSTP